MEQYIWVLCSALKSKCCGCEVHTASTCTCMYSIMYMHFTYFKGHLLYFGHMTVYKVKTMVVVHDVIEMLV